MQDRESLRTRVKNHCPMVSEMSDPDREACCFPVCISISPPHTVLSGREERLSHSYDRLEVGETPDKLSDNMTNAVAVVNGPITSRPHEITSGIGYPLEGI